MGMKPQECHTNSRFMEKNDPEGRTKQILGWWPQGPHYVLHSIVNHRGQFLCFTPVDAKLVPDATFQFLPDPKIEVREANGVLNAYRDGVKIGAGVRLDPAQSIAETETVRQRLLSGMDPYEAVKLP
jgi:hypothetical protein